MAVWLDACPAADPRGIRGSMIHRAALQSHLGLAERGFLDALPRLEDPPFC